MLSSTTHPYLCNINNSNKETELEYAVKNIVSGSIQIGNVKEGRTPIGKNCEWNKTYTVTTNTNNQAHVMEYVFQYSDGIDSSISPTDYAKEIYQNINPILGTSNVDFLFRRDVLLHQDGQNFGDFIDRIIIKICKGDCGHYVDGIYFDVFVEKHSLTFSDVSQPLSLFTDNRFSSEGTTSGCSRSDVFC